MIRKHVQTHAEIIAWCLMLNHFHILISANETGCQRVKQGGLQTEKITNCIRKLLSGYARIFNKKYNRSGPLFRQK